MITANTKKPKSFRSYNQGHDEILDAYLDDKEVCGLSGADKIELIEKVQCVWRQRKARRFVNLVRAVRELKSLAQNVQKHVPDYEN